MKNTLIITLAILLAWAIFGYRSIDVTIPSNSSVFSKDSCLKLPNTLPDVSLSIIKTAEWDSLEALLYNGGSWANSRIAVHSTTLIRHPQGTLLFDTGLGKNINKQFFENTPFWLKPFMAYEKHQPAYITLENEIKKNPIKAIILSHLHWDHVSGIEDFNNVEVWTTKEEYEWATDKSAVERSFIDSQQSRNDITWKFILFENIPYENFERSLDIFKDGSIILVPLAGHGPGAIGMFVNFQSGKRIFFTGDTTWTIEGFQIPAHKFWASSLLADHDKGELEKSILKVHRLMQEYPNMIIVPAHDDKVQRTIGYFPNVVH